MDAYSLGQILQEAREAKELDLADVVAKLRIRQPILEAFEAGEFEIRGVPEIQIRGLLRIYARHLELDEDHVLLLYDQMRIAMEKGRRGRRGRRQRPQPVEEPFSSTQPLQEIEVVERRRSGCRGVLRLLLLLLLSAAAIAIIVFVTVELVGIEAFLEPTPAPETERIAATATAPLLPSETPLSDDSPAEAVGRTQYTGTGILVSVLLTQRSWISIDSDGVNVYEGIADAETLLEYSAETEIMLSAANALALDVIWNGQRQGEIGERGQRVDMRFTMESAVITLGPGGQPTAIPPTAEVVVVAASPEPRATQVETVQPSPLPVSTSVPTVVPTAPPTLTPLPTDPPPPTDTPPPTEIPDPTAILPPRVTQAGLPPTKEGA